MLGELCPMADLPTAIGPIRTIGRASDALLAWRGRAACRGTVPARHYWPIESRDAGILSR